MRIAKSIFLVQLLILLSVTNASGYYFGGLDDYVSGVPSQEQKDPFPTSGRETLFSGTFAGIDSEGGALIIETEVPGFLGPEKINLPVAVSGDTTVNVCYRETGECKTLGTEGLDSLAALSPEALKDAKIHIMGYTEEPSRVISVETGRSPM